MSTRNAPNKEVQLGITTLTNSPTALTTTDTWVKHIWFCNKTSTGATVTVLDGNGKYFLNAAPVPGEGVLNIEAGDGDFYVLLNGLTWSASANTTIDVEICAFQRS